MQVSAPQIQILNCLANVSDGKRWRVKEIVGIWPGDTDQTMEVRAVNLTMPKLRLT